MGLSCSVRPKKKEIRKSQPQSTIYCCERDPKVWVVFMLRYFTRTLVRSILQLRTFQSYSEQSEKVMGCALITVTHEFIDTKMKVKCIISDYCELLSVTRRASFSARLLSMCFFSPGNVKIQMVYLKYRTRKKGITPFFLPCQKYIKTTIMIRACQKHSRHLLQSAGGLFVTNKL